MADVVPGGAVAVGEVCGEGLGLPGGGAAGAGVVADVDYEGVACGALDPAVCGGDVEVSGAAAEAAHVAYPGGGVGEAVEYFHGVFSVVTPRLG